MGYDGIAFLGFANTHILDGYEGIQASDHAACLLEMKLLPREQNEIEAWIIVVATASALFILSCFALGLYKVGNNAVLQGVQTLLVMTLWSK